MEERLGALPIYYKVFRLYKHFFLIFANSLSQSYVIQSTYNPVESESFIYPYSNCTIVIRYGEHRNKRFCKSGIGDNKTKRRTQEPRLSRKDSVGTKKER